MQTRTDDIGNDGSRAAGLLRRRSALALFGLTAVALLLTASAARAADRIYWANDACCNDSGLPSTISYANLAGGGGAGDLITGNNAQGTIVDGPMGLAIDSAAGRIYWANWGYVMSGDTGSGTTLSWANLDGSASGDLAITGPATVNGPHGIAIDPVAHKLYWTNVNNNTIDVANLDGSNSAVLAVNGTHSATVDQPRGLAIDPSTQKIYWANWSQGDGTTISWSSLDGASGGNLMTTGPGVTVDGPEGVAIDPVANRLYWGNFSNQDTISYVPLSGGSAQNLVTSPPGGPSATVDNAHGVAIDPTTGTIYWANFYDPGMIARASLTGSGGDDFLTAASVSPVRMDNPDLPVILKSPAGTGVPNVSGSSTTGSTLSCSQGSWAADIIAALMYRAPHTYAYQWSRDGTDIPGATSNTIAAKTPGAYSCRVTAANAAGSSSQTSAVHTVSRSSSTAGIPSGGGTHSGPPSNRFRLGRLRRDEAAGTATLMVGVPGPGKLILAERIRSAETSLRKRTALANRTVRGRGRVKLHIAAIGQAHHKLQRTGKVRIRVRVSFRPTGGKRRARIRVVELRKRIRA